MTHVWIVEIWEGGRWVPTTDASLTRFGAGFDVWTWQQNNPDDRFRVRQYVAVQGKGTRGR